jgi:Ca2+-binding RTX toxin-like protein
LILGLTGRSSGFDPTDEDLGRAPAGPVRYVRVDITPCRVPGSNEILEGTRLSDLLVGDGRPNLIIGREGNDLIRGLGGRDELRGDDGADDCVGGAPRGKNQLLSC